MIKVRVKPFFFLLILSLIISFSTTHAQIIQSATPLVWYSGDAVLYETGDQVKTLTDLSGNSNPAVQLELARQPITATETLLNNHKAIFFDGLDDRLIFNELSTVRTVYMVLKEDASAVNWSAPVLGAQFTYDFYRGSGATIFDNGFTNSAVKSGVTKLNNAVINPLTTVMPKQYAILNIETTGNVIAGNLSVDRLLSLAGYTWYGSIAEVVIYNQTLSPVQNDSVVMYLRNKYAPPVSLGPDITTTTFCDVELNAGKRFVSYLWNNGSTADSLLVNTTGKYWVKTTDVFGFESTDTINVTFPAIPNLTNKTICFGSSTILDATVLGGGYTYLWSNSETTPSINVNLAGNYSCIITDVSSCTKLTNAVTVTIDNFSLNASLGNDTTFCAGNTIALKKGLEPGLTYSWSNLSTSASISIQTTGSYTVTVTNINNCIAIDDVNVTITGIAPSSNFISALACKNNGVLFEDKSVPPSGNTIVLRKWDFGDASPIDNSINPAHTFADSLVYIVKLTVETDAGCVKDTTIAVKVYPKPAVDFAVSGVSCEGYNTSFLNLTNNFNYNLGNIYNWNFGDAASANNTSTLQTPLHIYSNSNNYSIKLIVQNSKGCIDSLQKNITVESSPVASFTTSATLCENQQILFTDNTSTTSAITSYSTDFGDLTIASNLANPAHVYATAGTYNIKYIIIAANGCSDTINNSIVVKNKPIAKFGVDGSLYAGKEINFKDSSTVVGSTINDWNWLFNGVQTSTMQNPNPIINKVGLVPVRLIAKSTEGCADTVIKNVKIDPLPVIKSATPLIWYSGDNAEYETGNQVKFLVDLSGNSNPAAQAELTRQPLTTSEILLNNHQALYFDGQDDRLIFNELSTVRTVYMVLKEDASASNWSAPVLGAQFTYDFYRGVNGNIFDNGFASTAVKSGVTKLNNTIINPLNTAMPKEYSILSIETTGNVIASNLAVDRLLSLAGYTWYGSIAEVVIYNQTLTSIQNDSVVMYFRNKYAPPVSLGLDITTTTFCGVELNAGKRFKNYLWNDGSTADSLLVNNTGKYWVKTTDVFGFESTDTVSVTFPQVNKLLDKIICKNDTALLDIGLTTSGYTFLWNTGATTPTIKAFANGNYSAVITDMNSCTRATDTATVSVDEFQTTAKLGNDTSFCAGNTIKLAAGSVSGLSYLWSTGATTTQIAIENSGEYSLILTNVNNCIAKDTINVTIIGVAPFAKFSSTVACKTSLVTFTDQSTAPSGISITDRKWDFGDGSQLAMGTSPAHLFADSLMYNIKLLVSADNGCSKDTTIAIKVYPSPVVNFASSGVVCDDNTTSFINLTNNFGYNTGNTYSWNFGNVASTSNTSSLETPSHIYDNATNYTVKLVVQNNRGCKDSIQKNITVQSSPVAVFTTSATLCEKQQIQFTDNTNSVGAINIYSTDFGDLTTKSTIKNPTHTYTNSGAYIVKYIVVAANGCSDTTTSAIIINSKPDAKFGVLGSLCAANTVNFTDSSTVTGSLINGWNWLFNGSVASTNQNPNPSFVNAGIIPVRLIATSNKGCIDTVIKNITINPLPNPLFTATPTYGNVPLPVTLSNNTLGSNTYSWNFGDGSAGASSLNATNTYQDTGTYTVTLKATNTFGCSQTATQTVNVFKRFVDLAVLNVSSTYLNGFLTVNAIIANMGTTDVPGFDIYASINNGASLKETTSNNFLIGSTQNYTFTSSVYLPDATAGEYICVVIYTPTNFIDEKSDNNGICIALNENQNKVLEPFPNPSNLQTTIPIIINNATPVVADLYDSKGKLVANIYDATFDKGLQFLTVETSVLRADIYALRIKIGDKDFVKKILVAH